MDMKLAASMNGSVGADGHLRVSNYVKDANNVFLNGAVVVAEFKQGPDNDNIASQGDRSAVTFKVNGESDGYFEFDLGVPSGIMELQVKSITLDGYTWDGIGGHFVQFFPAAQQPAGNTQTAQTTTTQANKGHGKKN